MEKIFQLNDTIWCKITISNANTQSNDYDYLKKVIVELSDDSDIRYGKFEFQASYTHDYGAFGRLKRTLEEDIEIEKQNISKKINDFGYGGYNYESLHIDMFSSYKNDRVKLFNMIFEIIKDQITIYHRFNRSEQDIQNAINTIK